MVSRDFVVLVVLMLDLTVLSLSSHNRKPEVQVPESGTTKKKKDITSYRHIHVSGHVLFLSDADLERLFEEWEENDEDKLEDDELPVYKRTPPPVDLDAIKAKAKSPEDLLKMTKKGQPLMMFVNVRDPSNHLEKNRAFTSKYTEIFQSMLRNNHIDCQVFLIDDDRAIFQFSDGSQAFDAKDFLLKQIQVTEVTLEGQQYVGAGAAKKSEL
ncbi:hypothetical protein NECAME_08683 [Necator americanus]|uniref:LDLR chaperone MESD n=1 Tax=Necator americanus TaxID=51031 RepID=W2TH99_NECAM|nr:hypothetical protein NECAME_08683 [Necator americanus]ETN81203.1 hypothetical protein NECAME_08683 [Necator americanus]